MIDPQDPDQTFRIVDLVNDTVWAPSGSSQSLELSTQRMTDSMGILQEWSEEELDNCSGRFLGETSQHPLR